MASIELQTIGNRNDSSLRALSSKRKYPLFLIMRIKLNVKANECLKLLTLVLLELQTFDGDELPKNVDRFDCCALSVPAVDCGYGKAFLAKEAPLAVDCSKTRELASKTL